jgi:hypothetical protein
MTGSAINPIVALGLAIALVVLGIRLVSDSRRSRKTGISHIPFQWPSDFNRGDQPLQFWISVSLASIVGYGSIVAAALCVLGEILRVVNAK